MFSSKSLGAFFSEDFQGQTGGSGQVGKQGGVGQELVCGGVGRVAVEDLLGDLNGFERVLADLRLGPWR